MSNGGWPSGSKKPMNGRISLWPRSPLISAVQVWGRASSPSTSRVSRGLRCDGLACRRPRGTAAGNRRCFGLQAVEAAVDLGGDGVVAFDHRVEHGLHHRGVVEDRLLFAPQAGDPFVQPDRCGFGVTMIPVRSPSVRAASARSLASPAPAPAPARREHDEPGRHAAARTGAHAQGISSSIRAAGHRLTSLVGASVR